jgi:hypothetical protein
MRRIQRARVRRRRRRATVLILLVAAAVLLGADILRRTVSDQATDPRARVTPTVPPEGSTNPGGVTAGTAPAYASTASVPTPSAPGPPAAARYPVVGPGTWTYATGRGPVAGSAGTLRRYRVAVENGMGQAAPAFAARVEAVLKDPRGWTASGQLRLQRVPNGASAEFTIYLATPGTSEKLCGAGGLRTLRYTSCRLPGQLIINVARYLEGVPAYGAPLVEYQAYAINHEVGHELGLGHEACPGLGRPAPVMQQQTLGLKGCVANAWPYIDGKRYVGPVIP